MLQSSKAPPAPAGVVTIGSQHAASARAAIDGAEQTDTAPALAGRKSYSERVTYLDGWRGLAIIIVLIAHFSSQVWGPAARLGGFAVDIFFVLSGRLMGEILFVGRQPLPTFFRRRAARIIPGLLFYATAMALVSLWLVWRGGAALMQPIDYLSTITFTYNYVIALDLSGSGVLAHTWSLAVEEHCYVLLACLALALSGDARRAKWLLLAAALLAMASGMIQCVLTGSNIHRIYWRTDVRLAPVFLSAATFLFLRGDRALAERWGPVLGWLTLPVLLACGPMVMFGRVVITYPLMELALALAVNGLDYAPARVQRLFSARVLTMAGLYSFSIYLWQQPFDLLKRAVPLYVSLLGIIVMGLVSYFAVERPARRWLNGLRPGPRHATAPPMLATLAET